MMTLTQINFEIVPIIVALVVFIIDIILIALSFVRFKRARLILD